MECIIQSNLNLEVQPPSTDQSDTSVLRHLLAFHQALAKDKRMQTRPQPSQKVLAIAKLLDIDKHSG